MPIRLKFQSVRQQDIYQEFVMAYPLEFLYLVPGEEITDEIIDYIQYSVEKGCSMQGMEDSTLQTLNVLRM